MGLVLGLGLVPFFGFGTVGGSGVGLGRFAFVRTGLYNPCGFGWLYWTASGVGGLSGSALVSATVSLLDWVSALDLALGSVLLAFTAAGGTLPPAKRFLG